MANRAFPETAPPLIARPSPAELVVPRRPLVPIFQALGISIHDVVNDAGHKRSVRRFYRIARRIDNETWLRHRADEMAYEIWLDALL